MIFYAVTVISRHADWIYKAVTRTNRYILGILGGNLDQKVCLNGLPGC